jgi:hypothetical protein
MTEILYKVLYCLGFSPKEILKKKHGSSPEITAEQFVLAILETESVPELAVRLHIGEQTANRIISKIFIPLLGKRTGGGDSWKLAVLNNAELKYCGNCKKLLPHTSFTKDLSTFDQLYWSCKECKSSSNAEYYSKNKDTYHKVYIENNRSDYNARNAARRAAKLQATPF